MQESQASKAASGRKRASQACMGCRSRKVRCDVVHRPHQCTNCVLDNTPCIVTARRTKYRKRTPSITEKPETITFRNSFHQPPQENAEFTAIDLPSPNEMYLPPASFDYSPEYDLGSPSTCLQELWGSSQVGYTRNKSSEAQPSTREERFERSKTAGINAHKPEVDSTAKMRSRSDAELTRQSHIIYSHYPFLDLDISGLEPDDVNFLEAQSCFSVPTREALDDFVREYFLHVHPGLPLLDEALFWDMYSNDKQSRCRSTLSLFVFQAMLFASCSFVPFSTLKSLGFTSMRNARDKYYRRAKLLFDFCGGKNLVSNSQGALLLSYNATMKDQRRTNSIWLATAIHLAQASGADQFHKSSDQSSATTNELKRLWWCCIVRDRILPLGVRRQLHITWIDLSQGHYMLSEQDFAREIEESQVYEPQTKRNLVQLFICLCELAVPLTDVIKTVYATGQSTTDADSPMVRNLQQTSESIRSCEAGLDAWFDKATIQFPTPAGIISTEESLVLYTNLMYIYYYSARFALYQHEAFVISLGSLGAGLDDGLRRTRNQLEDATLRITDNLKELIQLKVGKFLPISIVAYAALPLVLHILDVKLAKRPAQTAQKQGRLNVYMEGMKGMQNLYDGVDDVWTFVSTAVDYATVWNRDKETTPSDDSNTNSSRAIYSKSSASAKAADDWGNVLVQEPILYFRLSRTIDLSLALGRYSEDSALCLAPRSIRFPSPRLVFIDVGGLDQGVPGRICGSNKGSSDNDQSSEGTRDQFTLTSQMLDEIDNYVTCDFGFDDLESPVSLDKFEMDVEEVESSVL
ncbi:hypothetical protein FSARC_12003 [Fusarium sarcochroum]|uniref:Zn(2)-C6 fungal-type domain-containing protein n=1 Tax=Fusarium sarcochroum TaxID=1208366 RepID=A0A8H4WY71_9HYPO|nr:hypothetical protein FSARC_12003 [Fusarium sarcochroum]